MNELKVFNHKELGGIRTLQKDGQVWFVGKEVAEILGYGNGSRDINRHVDEEDRQLFQNYQNGTSEINNRGMIIINESGLYSLILSSKLPKAKMFKKWVTSEVLPTIRQTGAYVANNDMEHLVQSVVAQTTSAVMSTLPQVVSEAVKAMMNVVPRQEEHFELNSIDWNEVTYWENVLTEWRDFRRTISNKVLADERFIEDYNERYPELKLSRRSLYRKWKMFTEKGGFALIDRRGRHGNHKRKTTEITITIEE